jgi:hypothetical protein
MNNRTEELKVLSSERRKSKFMYGREKRVGKYLKSFCNKLYRIFDL